NAELVQLPLGFEHEGEHPLGNRTKVVVVEFLSLGRLGAEEGTAGAHQVRASEIEVAVDQEVFLLRAGGRGDERAIGVAEQLQNPLRLAVERLHRTQY